MKPVLLLLSLLPLATWAGEGEIALTLRNHQFQPAEVRVPAGQKIKLIVRNEDSTPEEFESHDLNREKIIPPGGQTKIFIGPLAPGRYTFYGEFHDKTARGAVIAE